MVPPLRNVTERSRPRPSERAIVEAAARHLEGAGYRTRVDPDGTDYFDLVARRGDEVGLVEAKVANARAVLSQALVRRVWGDWVAVVLSSERSARALAERTRGTRAEPVGVWWCHDGAIGIARVAREWTTPGREDPYAALRVRFRRVLDALDAGELPEGLTWSGVPRSVRRASGGRGFREWRLDEGAEAPR
jgi:hypothetical protein